MTINMLTLFIVKLALLLVVCGIIALMLTYTVKLMLLHHKYKHLPGPPRDSFFFGNYSLFQKVLKDETTFGGIFLKLHEEYGPLVLVFALHKPYVGIADPAITKNVLMDNRYLKPPESYKVIVDLFGERLSGYNLVSETDHEKWWRHRKVLNPAFHRQYLMELMYVFNDSADRLVKYLTSKADGKTEVDMVDALGRVTLDVIAKAGFSMEEDMISEKCKFSEAVDLFFQGARRNSFNPMLKFNPSKRAREFRSKVKEAIHLVRGTGEKLIRQRLKDQQDGKKLPKDILSYIIKAAMVDENFQLTEMVDEFVVFFVAGAGQPLHLDPSHRMMVQLVRCLNFWKPNVGHETTNYLLAFTLICLSQNPHVLDKVLLEIDTVIGDKEELLYEDIAKLEYMMLVLKETLRIFPPGIGTSRKNPEEFTYAGYKVPAGSILLFLSFVMSRQEQFFKDPMTFDPERFRRNEDSPLYAYFPFSLGARSCIGQQFALIEARTVLAKLLRKLRLELVPGQKLGVVDRLTLRPSNQCLHYITKRRDFDI